MQHAKMPGTSFPPRGAVPSAAADSGPKRSALFARYGALEKLRFDYPLVLVNDDSGKALFRPLSGLIDDVLRSSTPPGPEGEAMRQQVLKLEGAIRAKVFAGQPGLLSDLWRSCAAALLVESNEAPFGPLDTNLDRAREYLPHDGVVIGCDAQTPKAVLIHAWQAVHNAKSQVFRKKVDGLILRLSDILKADYMKSDAAHGPEALAASVGRSELAAFDFSKLSGILARARPEDRLPQDRVERIESALSVLGAQRFYGPVRGSESIPGQPEPHRYIFESCAAALDAYRDRLPEVLEFVKALTIAEMEVENKYRPDQHDPVFAIFDESDLTTDQVALLPAALVLLRDGKNDTSETVRAFEALASGLPIKILIQTDDILGPTSPVPSRQAFGGGSARLAAMAMGLNNAFALQASSAHLYRLRDALKRGMGYDGPALFCIYSGATPSVQGVAPYILAAAATESRAFPTFTYDPSAGPDWARRFDLTQNPQVEGVWPTHRLDYQDQSGQRHGVEIAFSFADFAISDARYARYCHPYRQEQWHERMMPASDWFKLTAETNHAPYVLSVDAENRLQRTGIGEKIVALSRRCEDAWRRLQELAGIENSHALRLLAQEREARERLKAPEAQTAHAASAAALASEAPAVEKAAPAPAAVAAEPQAPSGDAAWIETPRCTTCNECTQINSELFAYNENMQAYIANPDAGSFRQLVEAAESCQVSIIHPGKPRNPDEENLADLIERAKAFA